MIYNIVLRSKLIIMVTILISTFILFSTLLNSGLVEKLDEPTNWEIQSIDTMKYSRDLAVEKANDTAFEKTISEQVRLIAETGATHVAIGTPYDDQFLPYMSKWTKEARKQRLKVWYRGNFAGWEGWFGYENISPSQHKAKLNQLIINNPDLFEDGDILTPCTECENGSIGDPRDTNKVQEFRDFLTDEYNICQESMRKIGKKVLCGYFSMNGDVAKLIMDEETTKALGGIVTIDHYTKTPDQLISYIRQISAQTNGQVVVGEIGAPIPDIHGNLSDKEQAAWMEEALTKLAEEKTVVGINYWTSFGGSTRLWNGEGVPGMTVEIIKKFFSEYKGIKDN
jgi:hypothetical protein